MAGTGISGGDLLLLQQEAIGRASGLSEDKLKETGGINSGVFKIVEQTTDTTTLTQKLTEYLKQKMKEYPDREESKGSKPEVIIQHQIAQITSPWMLTFIRYNPAPMLEKVKCPVLAINGDKDLQVPSKVNIPAIENALRKGGNKKSTCMVMPGLNHLFQECMTGLPKEYAEIEQTIAPVALETMTDWIKKTGIK